MVTATAPTVGTITIKDSVFGLDEPLELELDEHTPQQVIEYLLDHDILMRQASGVVLIYQLGRVDSDRNVTRLLHNQTLAAQGVQDGDELALIVANIKG